MNNRKVGIIGVGHVGAHVAYSLAIQGIVDELVLADTDTARVESEYQDLLDALPHMPHRTRVSIGEYEDLADCDLIVNSAGHIELLLGSDDRSRELKFTIPAVHTWVDRVRKAGFDGVVLNISNPCDVVTREIAKSLGLPKGRVLGTGTGLDSARLVTQIVKKTNVDPNSIQAFMFGEHGNSMFAAWSCVTVNGLSCQTLQVTTPEAVAAYLASIGHKAGGFGYVEITYDEEAAAKAATEYYTAANGKKYPLIAFTFTYTATEASGKQQKGTFTDYYYFDA